MRFLIFFLGVLTTTNAFAFPEMIRHHYVNCTACHFSPAGGGLLNPYGRTISFDVLSTWGGEKEARPFYGAVDSEKLNQWLQLGGDVRAVQVHQENSQARDGRFIPMQEGIEVATFWSKFTASAFVGKTNMDWIYRAIATRYWAMYQAMDELTFRVGRFIPVFGLNIPQHTFNTRMSLGFGQGLERDSFETMWSGEKWNFAFTVTKNPRVGFTDVEQGESLQVNYTLADSYRLGASYWYGDSEVSRRQIFGLHAVLGFTEKLYALTEVDYQMLFPQTGSKSSSRGMYHFGKLGYEIFKGFHLQAVEEQSKGDLDVDSSAVQSYGVGFLFYPRPHFEIETLISKRKSFAGAAEAEDYDYLMLHYYF